MARLFRQFDDRKSGRSALDVAGAYQGLHPEVAPVDRRIALQALKGIRVYMKRVEGAAVPSGDDLGQWYSRRDFDRFILFMGKLCTPLNKAAILMRCPEAVAVAYGTFDKAETRAKEFWYAVLKSEYEQDSAAEALDRFLCARVDAKEDAHEKIKKLKPGQVFACCVKAWNAHLKGDSLRGLSHPINKDAPEIHS